VTIGIALSGAAAHFLQSEFIAGFERANQLSVGFVHDWSCQRQKASIKLRDDLFTMLVSRLQGDANGTKTEKISFALAQGGFQLLPICQSLQIDIGNELIAEQINAIERGKALVKEWKADLLIFGKVTDNLLLVWTVNQHGGCDSSVAPTKIKDDAQTSEFERETKAQLLGLVLKEIAAACRHGADMDWDLFARQMRKLTALIWGSKLDLGEAEQLELSVSYYNGLNLLYNHDGDNAWFEAASSYAKFEMDKGTDAQKSQAMVLYGKALLVKGQKTQDKDAFELGLKMMEEGLLKSPPQPQWRTEILDMLTGAYGHKGDDVHELRNMDAAIKLNPGDWSRLNNRCYLLAKIGQLKLALTDCNDSLKLHPNEPLTLDSRALTYLKMKQPDNAIKDYEAVLRLSPNNARALYGRGVASLMRGNKQHGDEDIAAAKVIQPTVADEFAQYGVK
jgi:tetratricopeptide (TPR) repeat protein